MAGEASHGVMFHACSSLDVASGVSAGVFFVVMFLQAVFATKLVFAEASEVVPVEALGTYSRKPVADLLRAHSSCGG